MHFTQQVAVQAMMLAVHSVQENFPAEPGKPPPPAVVATNVYLRTAAGWRMVAHHASPAPGRSEAPPRNAPKTLH